MDYELTLFDRLEVIKNANLKYDLEHNAYLSFSGGKDSTIVHYLLDKALPNNRIPRVFIDTGIEYMAIRKFVLDMAKTDDRFIILKPSQNIKAILEKFGYPFKSKEHSLKVGLYQKGSRSKSVVEYKTANDRFACPKMLLYQYEPNFKIKLSNQCCYKLKKDPAHKWEKQNNRHIAITGMRNDEGGERANIKHCIITQNNKVVKFHPLLVVDGDWESEFIKRNNVKLCELYYPPYNFERTGCKGCPFSLTLQEQLDTMAIYLPIEKKQCEIIWKPIYDEYRRLNYRLKKQMNIFE